MLRINTRQHGHLEIPTEQQQSVAEQILMGTYVGVDPKAVFRFYEVDTFDAPTVSTPVKPADMRADKHYLALRQLGGG